MYQRKLLAVVSVDEEKRVRCQHPGCTKTIYRSIHVIEDQGQIKVIGSTCIGKGGYGPFNEAAYTGTGAGGRHLTAEEAQQLANNTAELVQYLQMQYLARLELQEKARAAESLRLAQSHPVKPLLPEPIFLQTGQVSNTGSVQRRHKLPWAWVDPARSILFMEMEDGTQWLRVQAQNLYGGQHHLVPFPVFDGWDEYLPRKYGVVNVYGDGYELLNLIEGLRYMRSLHLKREVVCGSFFNVLELTRR